MQTWEKHGKGWFLVDESRVRGTEMPGLPEPLATDKTAEKTTDKVREPLMKE
jgi:hypothetical protein